MSQQPPSGNPFGDQSAGKQWGAPQPYGQSAPIAPGSVKTYLPEAIFCLICCGGLIAIPAIVYAAQVNSKLGEGDYNGAVQASENAKKWCIIAVCVGVICGGISITFQVLMFAAAGAGGGGF